MYSGESMSADSEQKRGNILQTFRVHEFHGICCFHKHSNLNKYCAKMSKMYWYGRISIAVPAVYHLGYLLCNSRRD